MFRTQFTRQRITSNAGERDRVIYEMQADEDGVLDLVAVGKESLYDYIQSFHESTDIHNILARFRNGDETVLSQRIGQYADVSMMPTNYADILNAVIKGENMFNNLPKETREKFGNNFAAFMAAMDDPKAFAEKAGTDVASALGFVNMSAAAVPAEAGGAAQSGAVAKDTPAEVSPAAVEKEGA